MRTFIENWLVMTTLVIFTNLDPIPEPDEDDPNPVRPITEGNTRLIELRRGLLWLHTIIFLWILKGKLDEFKRLGIYIWGVVTTDWLWLWIADRIDPNWPFAGILYLICLETVMCLVAVLVQLIPDNKGSATGPQIFIRGIAWPITLFRWCKSGNLRIIIEYFAGLWVILTMCWMFSGNVDVDRSFTIFF